MKIRLNILLKTLPLSALLISLVINASAQSQSFSWTVTGTGTETWYTDDLYYHSVSVSNGGYTYWTAPLSGQASYSFWQQNDNNVCDIKQITVPSTLLLYVAGSTAHNGQGSVWVQAGNQYLVNTFLSGAYLTVNFPDHYQQNPHTATRTASETGANYVSASDGQKNCSGFYCPPQPVNSGTMSGISYSLTWNNPNVILFFSDTRTTSTANPNANIIAIWLPSVQGLSVVQTNLNSIVFEVSPGLSTNYSIGGYCVGDGVTNYFGTGTGPTYFAANSLKPNTSYTFYISEWDWVNQVGGPVLVTNVATLPEPSIQGLAVVQTNLNSVVFSVTPGLSTNYSIGGYCVGGGVTNDFGTPPGPSGWGVNSLKPNTSYTFYIMIWDSVNQATGPVLVTNVTTLPEPSVQGLAVVQTNLDSVIFAISPGLSTNYSIGGYCIGGGVTNNFGTPFGPSGWGVNSLIPNTSYTFYIMIWDFVNQATGPVLVTNVTTLPVPTPTLISITPGSTNALLVCTNVFPEGGVCWMIMTNGVFIPSLAACAGPNSATNASLPFYFGIGNGSVPGASCFEPGTVYTMVFWAWLNGMWSGYVTNTFKTLEPASYECLSGQLLAGGKIQLAFTGDAGKNYALEYSRSLAPAYWNPVTTNCADSLGTLIMTNTVNTTGTMFWRIRAVQ